MTICIIVAWECPRGARKCKNNIQCVSETGICDGHSTCADGSDEDDDMCRGNAGKYLWCNLI